MSTLGHFELYPREIRDYIYTDVISIHDNPSYDANTRLRNLRSSCQLLNTNKYLRKEVLETWLYTTKLVGNRIDGTDLGEFLLEITSSGVDVCTYVRKLGIRWQHSNWGGSKKSYDHGDITSLHHLWGSLRGFQERAMPVEWLFNQMEYWIWIPIYITHAGSYMSLKPLVVHVDIWMGNREASMRELSVAYETAYMKTQAQFEMLMEGTKMTGRPDRCLQHVRYAEVEILDELDEVRGHHVLQIENMMDYWYGTGETTFWFD